MDDDTSRQSIGSPGNLAIALTPEEDLKTLGLMASAVTYIL